MVRVYVYIYYISLYYTKYIQFNVQLLAVVRDCPLVSVY